MMIDLHIICIIIMIVGAIAVFIFMVTILTLCPTVTMGITRLEQESELASEYGHELSVNDQELLQSYRDTYVKRCLD